jgi:flagellar capping protein FliD
MEIASCILLDGKGIKLDINSNRNYINYRKTWRLNTLLSNQWAIEEIKGKMKNFLESNENGNTTYQDMWDIAKAILRAKFTTLSAYIKKRKEISNK